MSNDISTMYTKDQNKKDVFKTVNDIVMQVHETQDAFIFSTLSKYAIDNFQIVIEKEELARAIQFIRMSKEYGPGIDERWTTATQQTRYLGDAYRQGFQDGVAKEHDRIINILEKEKENESCY